MANTEFEVSVALIDIPDRETDSDLAVALALAEAKVFCEELLRRPHSLTFEVLEAEGTDEDSMLGDSDTNAFFWIRATGDEATITYLDRAMREWEAVDSPDAPSSIS